MDSLTRDYATYRKRQEQPAYSCLTKRLRVSNIGEVKPEMLLAMMIIHRPAQAYPAC
jgi:hypothetical protein